MQSSMSDILQSHQRWEQRASQRFTKGSLTEKLPNAASEKRWKVKQPGSRCPFFLFTLIRKQHKWSQLPPSLTRSALLMKKKERARPPEPRPWWACEWVANIPEPSSSFASSLNWLLTAVSSESHFTSRFTSSFHHHLSQTATFLKPWVSWGNLPEITTSACSGLCWTLKTSSRKWNHPRLCDGSVVIRCSRSPSRIPERLVWTCTPFWWEPWRWWSCSHSHCKRPAPWTWKTGNREKNRICKSEALQMLETVLPLAYY